MIISRLIASTLLAGGAAAAAGTVHVANTGVDSPACGSFAAPCRTIGRGVQAARAGDTVLVRPGIYGDIDRDGVLGGAGEETPAGIGTLHVAKPVKILSTDGALATVIVGGAREAVVEIASNNVTFGGVDEGFTIAARQSNGISTDDRTNVRICGNVISGSMFSGVVVNSGGIVEISDNVVHDNAIAGIATRARLETQRVLVRRNKVYSNGTGIATGPFGGAEISFNEVSNNSIVGLAVTFAPTLVYRNVVVANGFGISAGSFGLGAPPSAGPNFVRNTIIANRQYGMELGGGPVHATLRENNFYANGLAPGIFANCAIHGVSGVPIDAAGSYWGAATGPGADPADSSCGVDPVITTPFASRPN